MSFVLPYQILFKFIRFFKNIILHLPWRVQIVVYELAIFNVQNIACQNVKFVCKFKHLFSILVIVIRKKGCWSVILFWIKFL